MSPTNRVVSVVLARKRLRALAMAIELRHNHRYPIPKAFYVEMAALKELAEGERA